MIRTKLKIRLLGDPCLREKAKEVKDVGPAERMLIESMIVTMHNEKGIGLAAPQVGVNSRIFVADLGEGPVVFINPKIGKKTGTDVMEEGCLSIPNVQVKIKRAKKVLVKYTDENNKPQEKFFEDLFARVIQHENDHLDGKLIVDYATKEEMERASEQLEEIKKIQENS